MFWIALIPFFFQSAAIGVDEFFFHRKRGLPRWERIGHPLDTLSLIAVMVFVWFAPYNSFYIKWFIALSLFSCFLITKDEFVHKECCPASEQWLHALLFINHPLLLLSISLLWPVIQGAEPWLFKELMDYKLLCQGTLLAQLAGIFSFFIYQIIYWNFIWEEAKN